MRRPLVVLAGAAAAWIAVACLDISSPAGNILAITTVLLPTPSVVLGDDLVDTQGVVTPLKVIAFGAHGDTIPDSDVIVRFFALDTTHMLHVDSITGIAWASSDSLAPLAKVVARVSPANGSGVLQTTLVPLPVVPKPVSATRSNDTTFVFSVLSNGNTVTDSFASSLLSPPLSVTVQGDGSKPVQSYVVSYSIVRSPQATNPGDPTVVIFDRSGNDSTVAITDVSGVATRQLRVRPGSVKDANLLIGATTDTVLVVVRVLYQGKQLTFSRNDTFVVPIRGSP
jgi:hypothetical protein